jgi:hypothetical protein
VNALRNVGPVSAIRGNQPPCVFALPRSKITCDDLLAQPDDAVRQLDPFATRSIEYVRLGSIIDYSKWCNAGTTVIVLSIIVLQLLELQFPIFLFRLVPDREFKTKLVELRFSFKIHSAIFEDGTLLVDPTDQLWVKAVASFHFTYNAAREKGEVLVEVFKDEGKTVDSPKKLTVTMFSMIILQLPELQIPIFLCRLVPNREFKTKLVELRFSFNIHSAIF